MTCVYLLDDVCVRLGTTEGENAEADGKAETDLE